MRPKPFLLALGFLIIWLTLSWFVPVWLQLRAPDSWILCLGLSVLGVAGAVAFVWFYGRTSKGKGISSSAAKDVDLTFAKAARRLKSSKFEGTRISQFTAVLLLGDTVSAKTTILQYSYCHSGSR
jgi:hypothetical protein